MVIANFEQGQRKKTVSDKLKQWDYGQVLRIQGLSLPTAAEIHFSLQESRGDCVNRIGVTKDGVTDVVIPDSMVENEGAIGQEYYIYAWVYLTDETSGHTEYEIKLSVETRSKPEAFDKPEDAELFREAIAAVNEAADRAEEAAKKEVADGRIDEAVTEYLDENGIKTDKTLTVDGGIADAKATGDRIDKKANKENPEFTGSISLGRKASTFIGSNSFAVGAVVEASGRWSHAEGDMTIASGQASHAEGFSTKASSQSSHAEGYGSIASGYGSHAEGYANIASGERSHAEGNQTKASGYISHAEGYGTTASGSYSHAEGYSTTAYADYSHAEGDHTTASGERAHAEGFYTNALKFTSHSEGCNTIASSEYQHVQGKDNIEDAENKYLHIVGNGSDGNNKSNAHTLDWAGNAWYQGSVTSNGADYAEFFEWEDENPCNEDRVGLLVTLDGEKIRLAETGDEILGIISGTAAVLGDNYECEWNGKYLTDDFGRVIYDEVEEFIDVITGIDEETNEPITEKKSIGFFKHPRLNPNYDPEQKYINRAERPEWDTVGMLGKLYLRDDGTCVVNGYAMAEKDGIATASADKTNMRVLSRVSENVIRVMLK